MFVADLSDDSYGTVVNMSMDQDGSSPHSGIGRPMFLHGATSPSYLPGHSPPHGHDHMGYAEQMAVYSNLGQVPPPGIMHGLPPGGADSEISNDSSPRGYPDFPPSPDSWLGEPSSAHYWPTGSVAVKMYKSHRQYNVVHNRKVVRSCG